MPEQTRTTAPSLSTRIHPRQHRDVAPDERRGRRLPAFRRAAAGHTSLLGAPRVEVAACSDPRRRRRRDCRSHRTPTRAPPRRRSLEGRPEHDRRQALSQAPRAAQALQARRAPSPTAARLRWTRPVRTHYEAAQPVARGSPASCGPHSHMPIRQADAGCPPRDQPACHHNDWRRGPNRAEQRRTARWVPQPSAPPRTPPRSRPTATETEPSAEPTVAPNVSLYFSLKFQSRYFQSASTLRASPNGYSIFAMNTTSSLGNMNWMISRVGVPVLLSTTCSLA